MPRLQQTRRSPAMLVLAAALALTVPGCSDEDDSPAPTPSTGSGTGVSSSSDTASGISSSSDSDECRLECIVVTEYVYCDGDTLVIEWGERLDLETCTCVPVVSRTDCAARGQVCDEVDYDCVDPMEESTEEPTGEPTEESTEEPVE